MAVLTDGFKQEKVKDEDRLFLSIDPKLSPVKAGIFPLVKDEKLIKISREIFTKLRKKYYVEYDQTGSIGKRYRRQDEIGTPFCITIDFDSLTDSSVTIRMRDTLEQKRIKIDEIQQYFEKALN